MSGVQGKLTSKQLALQAPSGRSNALLVVDSNTGDFGVTIGNTKVFNITPAGVVTGKDGASFGGSVSLTGYATTASLSSYATTASLSSYVSVAALASSNYVKPADLTSYVSVAALASSNYRTSNQVLEQINEWNTAILIPAINTEFYKVAYMDTTVTFSDLTVSGNLTVQGTTTTIDSVVYTNSNLSVDDDLIVGSNVTVGKSLTVGGFKFLAENSSNLVIKDKFGSNLLTLTYDA